MHGAQLARDADGLEWIAKTNHADLQGQVLAEAAAHHLGSFLGVPMPAGAIATFDGDTYWLSRFAPNASPWDATKADNVENMNELGRMLVLDYLIANSDRHKNNLLLTPTAGGTDWNALVVDQGSARIGNEHYYTNLGTRAQDVEVHVRGLIWDALEPVAIAAAQRAASLDLAIVTRLVAEPCEADGRGLERMVAENLFRRCQAAPDVVPALLQSLRALR